MDSNRSELVRQARVWVSQTFYGTMLKQMRNSPFRSDLFSGGRGGQMFASLLDQHMSERMGRGAATPLVNSIVRHLERGTEIRRELDSNLRKHVAPTPGY